jgi:hypothetical protein
VTWIMVSNPQVSILPVDTKRTGETMFKATVEIAAEIAHDLNVSRELVWDIIRRMRYDSVEELEIAVCKALAKTAAQAH